MEKKSVLIIMAPGFEEIELTAPADILRRLGVEVTLASPGASSARGAHGIEVRADAPLGTLNAADYDAVVVPGGPAAWDLCKDKAVLRLLRETHAAHKLIAAICAAPMVLAAAGVLRPEQRVTCYPAAEVQAAVQAAAVLTDSDVEVSDGLITGRGPAVALRFGFALGEALVGVEQVRRLRGDMCAAD